MSRRAWLRAGADRAFAVVFGDRRGALVFLVAVAAAALLWRNVVSINDNYTVANGLVAVSRGHVAVLEPTFGDTLASPGMVHGADGIVARNYAHIVLALPALWLLQAVAAIADLRLALAGAWCLSLLAIVLLVGRLIGRKRLARTGGAALAFAVFAVSTALATPLEYPHLAFLALQLTTILIAGLSATLLYRVLCRLHDARTGLTAGLAVALASPGLLWASIPKRHVLTAGFALATLYLLVRSRDADTTARARRFRALAYAPVGLTAWLNAAEGLLLLFALLTVDLLTAREHGRRTLATVTGVFALSLVPLFVTNAVVAGDPLTVPRMLPPADGGGGGDIRFVGEIGDGGLSSGSGSGGTSGGTGGSGAGSGSSGGILVGIIAVWQSLVSTLLTVSIVVFEPVLDVLQRVGVFASFLSRGVDAATSDPSKIYHTFVRSGHVGTSGRGATGLAINLTLLESLPLAGVAVALPTVARRWRRSAELDSLAAVRAHLATPARTADLFVLAYAIAHATVSSSVPDSRDAHRPVHLPAVPARAVRGRTAPGRPCGRPRARDAARVRLRRGRPRRGTADARSRGRQRLRCRRSDAGIRAARAGHRVAAGRLGNGDGVRPPLAAARRGPLWRRRGAVDEPDGSRRVLLLRRRVRVAGRAAVATRL